MANKKADGCIVLKKAYLNVSPQEFFDIDFSQSEKMRVLEEKLKKLTPQQLDSVDTLVSAIIK